MYRRIDHDSNADLCDRVGEVFRVLGYSGASISAVAGSAGLSKASLYHHFPGGKLQMAERVVDRATGSANARVFEPLHSADPALARLNSMLDGYLQYTGQGHRPCLLVVLGLSAPEPVRARIREQFRNWQVLIESTLCELREVKPKRAARLAEETLCGLYGSTLLGGLVADPTVVQRAVKRLRKTFETSA